MRRSPILVVIGLLAAAFFFTPAVAALLGARAKTIENRALTPFPSLDRGWHIFAPLTQWTVDHLPLRASAVRVNARLSERLFSELPSRATGPVGPVGVGQAGPVAGGGPPAVASGAPKGFGGAVPGSDGWLYLSDDFIDGCHPVLRMSEVESGLIRLDSIVRGSGRRLVIVSPPDKSGFSPEHLPRDYPTLGCAQRAHAARAASLQRLRRRLPGLTDVAFALRSQQRAQGSPIYLPQDSHWSERGAAVYAETVARAINPALLRGTQVVGHGPTPYIPDLTPLTGDPRTVRQTAISVVRRGVEPGRLTMRTIFPGGVVRRVQRTPRPGGAPLYPGRTVVYGDSFSDAYGGFTFLSAFFRDVTLMPGMYKAWQSHRLPQAEAALISSIRSAHVFVYEQVERQLWGVRVASVLRPEFLDALERALRRR